MADSRQVKRRALVAGLFERFHGANVPKDDKDSGQSRPLPRKERRKLARARAAGVWRSRKAATNG